MSKERPKRNIIQKKYVSRASAFCLLLPPDAAALVQVAPLLSAEMRKLSSRTAKLPAGQPLRDVLLKGSAASWLNVLPFLRLLFKETAVFTRRRQRRRRGAERSGSPAPDMFGGDAGLGCLARSAPLSGEMGLRTGGSCHGDKALGGFETKPPWKCFQKRLFVWPFLPSRSGEDEPVGHGSASISSHAERFVSA